MNRDAFSPQARRPRGKLVVTVALGVLAVGTAVGLGLRLRPSELPPPPFDESALGPVPSDGPWYALRDATPALATRREEIRESPPLVSWDDGDENIALDEHAVDAVLARLDASWFDETERLVERVFDGSPMVDGCSNALEAYDCSHASLVAEQLAEVLVVQHLRNGDSEGADTLLGHAIVSLFGQARTARTVTGLWVALSGLQRAVAFAMAAHRTDRPLHPPIVRALTALATEDVDLGRGWIGQTLYFANALRLAPAETLRERLFFSRATAARLLFEVLGRCVEVARDASAPVSAPLSDVPSDLQLWLAGDHAISVIIVNHWAPTDCALETADARERLETMRRRARVLLSNGS